MLMQHDLGASLYKTWNDQQRREEIARLVQGFRSGLPVGILCKMAETIAGDRAKARSWLHQLMPLAERQAALARESAAMQQLLRELLL